MPLRSGKERPHDFVLPAMDDDEPMALTSTSAQPLPLSPAAPSSLDLSSPEVAFDSDSLANSTMADFVKLFNLRSTQIESDLNALRTDNASLRASIENKSSKLSEDKTTLKTEVETLREKVEAQAKELKQVGALKSQVSGMRTSMATLTATVKDLSIRLGEVEDNKLSDMAPSWHHSPHGRGDAATASRDNSTQQQQLASAHPPPRSSNAPAAGLVAHYNYVNWAVPFQQQQHAHQSFHSHHHPQQAANVPPHHGLWLSSAALSPWMGVTPGNAGAQSGRG